MSELEHHAGRHLDSTDDRAALRLAHRGARITPRGAATTALASAAWCGDDGRGCCSARFGVAIRDDRSSIRVQAAEDAHEIHHDQRPNRFLAQYELGE